MSIVVDTLCFCACRNSSRRIHTPMVHVCVVDSETGQIFNLCLDVIIIGEHHFDSIFSETLVTLMNDLKMVRSVQLHFYCKFVQK